MTAFKDTARHILNPLHVFCRLRQLGMSVTVARSMCRVYEYCVYRLVL
jgi:hypothetical protein